MSQAKVIFDYEAEADDELTLKEGDLIRNIEKKEDGWWEGDLLGKRGMFPENFVEEIKPAADIKNSASEGEVKAGPDKNDMNDKSSMAKVTFDYDAENEDELSLKEGEMVKVIDQEEEGWWKGELNGKVGVFPSNFVELIKGAAPRPDLPPEPEPPKEPATGEKKAKMMGGMGMGINLDALSKVKLKKGGNGGNGAGSPKAEKPSAPSELSKRLSMKRNPPKISDADRPPKPPPARVKERAIVEFEYDGEQSDELTLRVGEIVTILEKDVNEGWSKGELNGKVGLFPDNFVKLLPPEQPKKDPEMTKSKSASDLPRKPPLPVSDDGVDAKPNRPEFPKLKKTMPTDRPPPPSTVNQNEIPVKLKPVATPPDDISKKSEPPPLPDSKPVDEKPKPPIKKAPPSLPKKPDKPRPQDLALNPERPSTVMRHLNGVDKDPNKRYSAAVTPSEKPDNVNLKRYSQGADLGVNLNDIKSSAVLQPLTTDRPKNPARNPPTKYGKPSSPIKKTVTPETPHAVWPRKEDKEPPKKPIPEKPVEKPPKPAILEVTKPASAKPESKVDSAEIKKLHDELNTFKNSLELITKQFKEHVQKSENQLQKMEKKFTNEIEDITKELDEEKKLRAAVDVEVNRLRKLIKNQLNS